MNKIERLTFRVLKKDVRRLNWTKYLDIQDCPMARAIKRKVACDGKVTVFSNFAVLFGRQYNYSVNGAAVDENLSAIARNPDVKPLKDMTFKLVLTVD